jgi:hypothetical protein
MVTNARIAHMIREHRTEEIPAAIAEGGFHHMQTFEQALIDLVLSDVVDQEVAADAATNRHDFLIALDYALKRHAAAGRQSKDDRPAGEERLPDLPFLRSVDT